MVRRIVLVVVAAAALTLSPAVAMASAPAGVSFTLRGFTLRDATPAPGVPFTVHASGATSNEVVTLTMTRNPTSVGNDGVRSITKNANASGAVDFAVALAEDGVWELVSTGSTGAVLDTQKVTVADRGTVILGGVSAGPDTAVAPGAGAAPGAVAGAGADTAAGPGTAPSAGADTPAGAGVRAGAVPSGVAVAGGPATIGQLSRTGFPGMGLAAGGGLLLLVGGGAVLVARRGASAQLST